MTTTGKRSGEIRKYSARIPKPEAPPIRGLPNSRMTRVNLSASRRTCQRDLGAERRRYCRLPGGCPRAHDESSWAYQYLYYEGSCRRHRREGLLQPQRPDELDQRGSPGFRRLLQPGLLPERAETGRALQEDPGESEPIGCHRAAPEWLLRHTTSPPRRKRNGRGSGSRVGPARCTTALRWKLNWRRQCRLVLRLKINPVPDAGTAAGAPGGTTRPRAGASGRQGHRIPSPHAVCSRPPRAGRRMRRLRQGLILNRTVERKPPPRHCGWSSATPRREAWQGDRSVSEALKSRGNSIRRRRPISAGRAVMAVSFTCQRGCWLSRNTARFFSAGFAAEGTSSASVPLSQARNPSSCVTRSRPPINCCHSRPGLCRSFRPVRSTTRLSRSAMVAMTNPPSGGTVK